MKRNLVNHSFTYRFYSTIMPFVYNVGAAVVIFGAMFKLLNLPGGNIMLGLGLSTEAFIFLLSAFEPKEEAIPTTHPLTQQFDQCLEKASIDTALLENLATAMRRFSENIAGVPSFAEVGAVTETYVHQVSQVTHTLTLINNLYKQALGHMEEQNSHTYTVHNHLDTALKAMEVAGTEAMHFKQELALLNEKVTALNAIYAKTLTAFKG